MIVDGAGLGQILEQKSSFPLIVQTKTYPFVLWKYLSPSSVTHTVESESGTEYESLLSGKLAVGFGAHLPSKCRSRGPMILTIHSLRCLECRALFVVHNRILIETVEVQWQTFVPVSFSGERNSDRHEDG